MVNIIQESIMLQAHAFFEATLTRRAFVIRAVQNTKVKDMLLKQECDEFLFGKDLDLQLKKLKSLEKASQQFAGSNGRAGARNK